MAYWMECPGGPVILEEIDHRTMWCGESPRAQQIFAPVPPFRGEQRPMRIARPWREEPSPKQEGPITPEEVVARLDAWSARERRPMLPPDRPARARRGQRRGGYAETGLSFRLGWWS